MSKRVLFAIIILAGLVFGATQPQQIRKAKDGPLCIPHLNCPM